VRSWKLREIETPDGSRSPVVLHSSDEGRAVLIGLAPGQQLGDHQVKEHAFIVVVDGTARIESGGETLEADAGTLIAFEPDERRVVATAEGAKLLLLLAPWPGEGHYRGGDRPAAA
jgi:quercetin dioxygenase-like cupin family protein